MSEKRKLEPWEWPWHGQFLLLALVVVAATLIFVFPPALAKESMNEQIRLSVDLLNESMANSGIAATFRIVGIEQLDGMPDSQSRATRMIETEKAAARRRDALGADLVWALVHDPSGTLGVACQPDNFDKSTADLCFTTSLNSCGAGGPGFGCDHVWRTALRHEAGHNLGIAHSPEFGGDPQLSVPARGSDGSRRVFRGSVGYCGGECWGFKNSSEPSYGTVMGGNTLPVFSSSSYDFQGQVVGERGTHEAATALAWTTDFVSHYRPNGPEPPKPPTDCEPTASLIDFPHGYTVSMCFEYEKDGETVKADAVDYGLESDESGLLYFFDRDNAEVLVKVLDGCGVNGHRWVFVAPLTTLAFNLYVESPDGKRWMHSNAAGRTAEAKSDTSAFACAG